MSGEQGAADGANDGHHDSDHRPRIPGASRAARAGIWKMLDGHGKAL